MKAFLSYSWKVAWAVVMGMAVVVGLITGVYGLLNATGTIETSVVDVIEAPGNLQEFLDKGILVFDYYLQE